MVLVRPTQRWHSRLIQVPHVGPVYRPRTGGRTAIEFDVPEKAIAYLLHHSFVRLVDPSEAPPPLAAILEEDDSVPLEREVEPDTLPVSNIEEPVVETAVGSTEEEVKAEETEEEGETNEEAPASEFSLEQVCAFLQAKSRNDLMQIKGIGPKAAGEMMKARPLDQEKLLGILKDNQIQAVIEAMRG